MSIPIEFRYLPAGYPWEQFGPADFGGGYKFPNPGDFFGEGITYAKLKSGEAGKAKVLVKRKGYSLSNSGYTLSYGPRPTFSVTVQLINDQDNVCFESVFTPVDVFKNDGKQLKLKNY